MASFFQSLNTDDDQITDTAKNNPKRLDCQTLQFVSHVQIHCACQCVVTLAPKILWYTVAHSTFKRLDHHDISKIVILPHKSHVSHKYKCMNDGFFTNNARIKKKSSAQNTILCRKWLLQKLTFHHNEITVFENIHNILLKEPWVNLPPLAYIYICFFDLCLFKLMFYGLYHGKSPLNHHLEECVLLVPSILSKSKKGVVEIFAPKFCSRI